MPHCTAYFIVSANHENMHTPRIVKKKNKKKQNTTAIKSTACWLTRRNCSSSYGGRRSRRRTAASSIGCAPGEGTALLVRALLNSPPSLPLSLLLCLHHHCASLIRHMCQRGVVSCKRTPRRCPAKAAQLSSMSVQMLEGGRIWILYSAALPPWARHRVRHLFNFISLHHWFISCFINLSQNLAGTEPLYNKGHFSGFHSCSVYICQYCLLTL